MLSLMFANKLSNGLHGRNGPFLIAAIDEEVSRKSICPSKEWDPCNLLFCHTTAPKWTEPNRNEGVQTSRVVGKENRRFAVGDDLSVGDFGSRAHNVDHHRTDNGAINIAQFNAQYTRRQAENGQDNVDDTDQRHVRKTNGKPNVRDNGVPVLDMWLQFFCHWVILSPFKMLLRTSFLFYETMTKCEEIVRDAILRFGSGAFISYNPLI